MYIETDDINFASSKSFIVSRLLKQNSTLQNHRITKLYNYFTKFYIMGKNRGSKGFYHLKKMFPNIIKLEFNA